MRGKGVENLKEYNIIHEIYILLSRNNYLLLRQTSIKT